MNVYQAATVTAWMFRGLLIEYCGMLLVLFLLAAVNDFVERRIS